LYLPFSQQAPLLHCARGAEALRTEATTKAATTVTDKKTPIRTDVIAIRKKPDKFNSSQN